MSHQWILKYFKRQFVLVLLIILAGFALRLYRLGGDSLWYDETVSAYLAAESVPELLAHTARDIHPPAYYLLLHFWTRWAGQSEFALAFFSLVFGVLLIPLTFLLAKRLTDNHTAMWSALLVAWSPYHLWYAQEVRMYTLGATLAIITAYCAWQVVLPRATPGRKGHFWLRYVLAGSLGLYTLYYFAFFLIALNLATLLILFLTNQKWNTNLANAGRFSHKFLHLVWPNLLILIAYLPWLPTAWRQATNPPVPPWRTFEITELWPALVESWSALALGQSVDPAWVWPVLLLILVLFYLGFRYLNQLTCPFLLDFLISPANLFLLSYLFGPLCLIFYISIVQPLYHVRYLFTYSAAFYIILGAGLAWLNQRRQRWPALLAIGIILATSTFSIYRYHVDPRYRPDDYRSAVQFIQQHWQPGDVILVNAGYAYPTFVYYNTLPNLVRRRLVPYEAPSDANQPLLWQTGTIDGSQQLGWGDLQADFYAMSVAETTAALEQMSHDFARLWLLRAYDTVTDPTGLIRSWLTGHATPLEDQPFAGESNIRVQGWLLPGAPPPPAQSPVEFADGMKLVGLSWPNQVWSAGQTIQVRLWWATEHKPGVDYKMSLKLWAANGSLAAQGRDEWPVGALYRATTWPTGQAVYQPAQITLPETLAAGQYWLNIELYHPETGQPLARLDGTDPVVTLGSVTVEQP